ncbi:sn-glycerol 3-phosphate transport system permease protein [Hyphomicrobiales bacterium]|nr:sn-glycerol 3-phosphate transport system permease protein [Hyphomicrobiales bacterium]CAH1697480.1 sn-glycerol 3-phosphate transport system permease protein [Hyphomicrobiales bacterium]CAI0345668.1 multiple sugar transport system permease protein [Hyphomicrobiales bacterium]
MKVSRNALYGSLLLLPATVLLWAFTYQPILTTIINSFYSTPRGRRPSRFIGFEHYATMAADPVFWKALTNNLIYAAATIPLSIVLALAMALLVQGSLRGTTLTRMAFFTPTVLPMVAVANIWLFFYAPDYGLIDQVLSLFGLGGNNWLGNRDTALWALIVITVWKEAGFFMIFYLAGLQQISPTLLEAADLEGASYWQRLRRVVIPLLMPTTLFIAINAVIGAFRLVDHVVAMTKGGPDNATMLLLYYLYQVGFSFWDTNYAAAITVVLLAFLAAIALFQFGYADKRVHYR